MVLVDGFSASARYQASAHSWTSKSKDNNRQQLPLPVAALSTKQASYWY
jgi:hypothetical protein